MMIHQADRDLKSTWGDRFASLSPDARKALRDALCDLRTDALSRAELCWTRHKAPMALYWKCVGVYAGHLAKAIGRKVDVDREAAVAALPDEPKSPQDRVARRIRREHLLFDNLKAALIVAKKKQSARFGAVHYVVKCHDGSFEVQDSMPYMGEWYSSDGIRHG